jgi:DNA repair protein RecN (Recombination protein N)
MIDLLRYQVQEIEQVAPQPGEADEIQSQISRLQHIEKLSTASFAALSALSEQENSAVDLLGTSLVGLEEGARYDPSLEEILAPLRECRLQLDEALRSLSDYAQSLEADPAMLDELAARLDSLKRLRRKYGDDETAVLSFLDQARERLGTLESSEAGEEELAAELEVLNSQVALEAAQLTALRKARGTEFSSLVEEQLKDLVLERARFEVAFRPKEPDQTGADDVEFYFSANPGEPLRPLSRIASGGEVSRLMLAIKSVLAGKAGVPTLIFDEVDSGLGGRVASTLGRKLAELSRSYQVLVISHLPQVAACADVHFKIEKLEQEGRTVTQVRRLGEDERVEELARMLGGETVTSAAIANARELLGKPAERVGLFD